MTTTQSDARSVFISYAHESLAHRTAVGELVQWLSQRGCNVVSDHAHSIRPPEKGWTVWMMDGIREADVVLVICTPKLKASYEKEAPAVSGLGGTFEGAIVSRSLYSSYMRNTKFYPVLPDGGSINDVPEQLSEWWNGHTFPRGNERIRQLVHEPVLSVDVPQATTRPPVNGAMTSRTAQAKLALERVEATAASSFFRHLQSGLKAPALDASAPTPSEVIAMFAASSTQNAQQLCDAVRQALYTEEVVEARAAAENAAVALYFLAACGLVNDSARTAGAGESAWVLRVPTDANLLCAVIAIAVFGGKLLFKDERVTRTASPLGVFAVQSAAAGDHEALDFERAVYMSVFGAQRDTPMIGALSGPLNKEEQSALKAKLRTHRLREHALTFVVPVSTNPAMPHQFAKAFQVPIFVPAGAAANELLAMSSADLLAELGEFIDELTELSRAPTGVDPISWTPDSP